MKIFFSILIAAAAFAPGALSISAKAASPAVELARQLNQAFIEVADQVSPAVVVIRVAHKANVLDLEDEENPFWDLLPRQYRKQLEEQWEKHRQDQKEKERPSSREIGRASCRERV